MSPNPLHRTSDTSWFGEIPNTWNQLRTKMIFTNLRERKKEGDDQLSATQKFGVIPQKLYMENEDTRVMLALAGTDNFKHVDRDDFVISLRSFEGGIERCFYDGCVSPAYTVMKAQHPIDSGYFQYLFKSRAFINEMQLGVYGIRDGKAVNFEDVARIRLPYPSIADQTAIAVYLDAETKRIDDLIGQKGLLVSALGEMHHAAVNDAVCGRSDIDTSCPSNKWKKCRLRFMASVSPRPSIQLDPDAQVSFLPMESISENGTLKLNQLRRVDDVAQGYTYFEEGDVTVAKITPCFENGKGAVMKGLVGGVGFGTTELIVLRPESNVDAKFLYYVTQSAKFRLNGEASMCGAGGQKRVSDLFIKDFEMLWPTLEAQKIITTHLDTELDRIDHLEQHVLREMELLIELRATTITDAVLGRIDVRKAQAH